MGGMILTLTFRDCSGNVPGNCSVPNPSSGRDLFLERSLGLFQEQSARPVPGTFLEELFLEHAPKLLQARKGEAYERWS